jgi:RNA recognition motif-containing protein
MYDQPKFMNLVQSLSASTGGIAPLQAPSVVPFQTPISTYPITTNPYEPTTVYQPPVKTIMDKAIEYNLHVSGFGPSTTEADIIAYFSPYVRINEVIMKGTVAFVNTTDPVGASRAKDILAGTLVGGMPLKITQATRKSKDANNSANSYTNNHAAAKATSLSSYGHNVAASVSSSTGSNPYVPGTPLPPGMPDVDAVRDDRGNPATKNLFIAGYGPSTTEHQLRDIVSQYVCVVGVILKGTFSFVNTMDRASAVYAREMLGGTMLNGGVIRINFAKETGRLGTSFDLTYGPNTGPNALNAPNDFPIAPRIANNSSSRHQQPNNMSYYGRGDY